ncbi:cache domain-containing protein [Desulfospira joergensenii]|uniref:cache domain-containing protein n=1 Tax=Desulfospira joergensenii TaxID=53329 RepID=UPI0003B3ECBB|nr:cache domain-containing protein [Desulfospira joergensenii]
MRGEYLEKQRQRIKSEVIRVANTIDYEMDKVFQEAKTRVKARVSVGHAIAQNLYNQNQERMPEKNIQKIIIDSLRPIRLGQGEAYYFINGLDGISKLFADRPDQEGLSFSDKQDTRGQYVLKDMIKIVKSKGEGFYSYHWTKPGHQGNDFKKIAYVKLFKPFDWFIGTGIYLDDLESAMQKTISHYVETHRFGPNKEGYVFVYELLDIHGGKNFARVYANPNLPNDTGKTISDDYKDAKGKPFRKEFLKGLRQNGECFVDYWYKKIDDPEPQPKTSFFKLAGNGRFIAAAGVYLEDVENQILLMQTQLKSQLRQSFLIIASFFIAVILIVLLLTRLLNKRLKNDFQLFAKFFKLAAGSSLFIDREKVKFSELDQLAESANKMLSQKAEAEKALRLTQFIFDKASIGIFHIGSDARILNANGQAAKSLGYTVDELSNMTVFDINPTLNPGDFDPIWQTLCQNGDNNFETVHLHKNGTIFPVEVTSNLIEYNGKQFSISFVQDITERKQVEEALRKSKERLGGIVETMADWIWEVDSGGRYIYCSKRVEKILGYSPEEMMGKTPFDFMAPDEAEKIGKAFEKIVARKEPIKDLENWNISKNGRQICLLTNGVPVIGETGELLGFRGVDKDITEQKQADKKRKELEAQLQQTQKMEAIGTLAGGIAHDFNNILSGILGYSQLAQTHLENPEKARTHIEQIIKGGQRATELTRQILTFSRQSEYQKLPFRIYLEIKEALKLLRSTIPSTIEIKSRLDSKKLVLADPIKIHQVIMNLCTNAYHAMRKTGGYLTVSLMDLEISDSILLKDKKGIAGEYVKLEVSDTGHGMDEKTLGRAFDPYFTTKKKGDGTGLGLALVQAIVEEHDGFLEVFSEPGKGTSFYLYFPIVREGIETTLPKIEDESQLSGNETIMVVDDEDFIRQSGKELLEDHGYRVETFDNGMEALEAFKAGPNEFDLIITDMTMPGITGDRLSAEILKIKPDIPIILCTGFSENISQAKALELGIRLFIQKPILNQDLVVLVRRILDKNEDGIRP